MKRLTAGIIHPIPAPYRDRFFTELSNILLQDNIQLNLFFEYGSIKRRLFWNIDTTLKKQKYRYIFLKTSLFKKKSINPISVPSIKSIHQIFKLDASVYICTGFSLHTIICFFICYLKKIPFIIWTGENKFSYKIGFIRKLIRKYLINKTSLLLSYGSATNQYYIDNYNYPEKKICKLINSIPIKHKLEIENAIKIKIKQLREKKIKLIFIGELRKKKGVLYFKNLLIEINKSLIGYTIEFTIIGEGKFEKKLKDQFIGLDDSIKISFLGRLSNDKVLQKLSKHHFLIFPTLGEPWGHVISEAFHVGTPVLSSKYAGAIYDILEHSQNGFVVDFTAPNEVSKTIKEIIVKHDDYIQMCKDCYLNSNNHDRSVENAQKLKSAILNLINKKNTLISSN